LSSEKEMEGSRNPCMVLDGNGAHLRFVLMNLIKVRTDTFPPFILCMVRAQTDGRRI
jgi:hypothetical protein